MHVALSQELLEQRMTRPFKYFERVESSNDCAKAWLADGAPEGAVVIANEQTRGRGRKGRGWHSPPNQALALSLILKPDRALLPRLNMVAALSVSDIARAAGCEDVGIKWPNDIQVKGLKLSGILPEAVWQGDQLRGAVLGIGLNIRLDFSETELRHAAISLEQAANRTLDRRELLTSLLCRLDYWYAQIASPVLFATWKSRLLTLHQWVTVGSKRGVAVNVAADGALLIRDETGQIHQTGAAELINHTAEALRQ